MKKRRNYRQLREGLKNKIEKINKRNFPLIKQRILDYSLSNDFEEARREWEFTRVVYEGEEDFTDQCQICNSPGLKVNFEITNPATNKSYLVGSTCIKRFIIFAGAQTQEESNAIFDRLVKKEKASLKLHRLLPAILSEPTPKELYDFKKTSQFILNAKSNTDVSQAAWNNYLRLLFGKNPPKKEITQRIATAIFNPKAIKTKKVAMPTSTKEGAWAHVTKTKKTRVNTTLARSTAYKPEHVLHEERDE